MALSVTIVLLVCAGVVVSIPEDAAKCCPQNDNYLRRNASIEYCWDQTSNITTPMEFTCGEKAMGILNYLNYKFVVNDVGQLEILQRGRRLFYEPKAFCTGQRASADLTNIYRVALVCDERPHPALIGEEICGFAMIISALLLLATAIIYATQRKLRDLQGISIINFCGSLAIGLGILAGMKLVPYSDMSLCTARGFFTYFFIMAGFFWMNVLSTQIFLHMRRSNAESANIKEDNSILWYAVYAWGCPAAITVAMAVVNFSPGEHLKPGIGLEHCWFYDTMQQWIYLYSVMAILISVNVFIFIYSMILLWHQQRDVGALKYKILMTLRLFVLMGLPWTFEMVSSVSPHSLFWEIMDVLNSLQGVFIFVVLVIPLLPCWSSRENGNRGDKYNSHVNISVGLPYDKFVS